MANTSLPPLWTPLPPMFFRSPGSTDGLANAAWYREQLARFTYKPGWTFAIQVYGGRGPYACGLEIRFDAEDTYHPGKTIKVGVLVPLMDSRDPDRFARTVLDHIRSMEDHEAREWFKVEGEIFDNPHAQDPQ